MLLLTIQTPLPVLLSPNQAHGSKHRHKRFSTIDVSSRRSGSILDSDCCWIQGKGCSTMSNVWWLCLILLTEQTNIWSLLTELTNIWMLLTNIWSLLTELINIWILLTELTNIWILLKVLTNIWILLNELTNIWILLTKLTNI